ncbi:uncharacterized protein N7487_001672 [Penicillium crustosum]|uniref:uncharacterized protein n=1 Tax=Penicillium crustosum TaxID=36656 RepID=UPI00180DAC4E|nr:uncharacterized protein N7487_001672 [Penicillium crustosum]KAF4768803.1 hypothetical protein HAV15_008842 [Penicillium sp. str. \
MPTIRLLVAYFAVQNASSGKLLLMLVFLLEKLALKFLDLLLLLFNFLLEIFNLLIEFFNFLISFVKCLTQSLETGILVHH